MLHREHVLIKRQSTATRTHLPHHGERAGDRGHSLQPMKEAGGAAVGSRHEGVASHEGVPVMKRCAFAILLWVK